MTTGSYDIRNALASRILIVDGAMGTSIQTYGLSADAFGGPEYEGCNENLNLTSPDLIESIHRSFLLAGADIIETNTFGSTPLVLEEYGIGHKGEEISMAGAALAKKVAALAKSVGGLAKRVGALAEQVAALAKNVAALAEKVAALAKKVAALAKKVAALAKRWQRWPKRLQRWPKRW